MELECMLATHHEESRVRSLLITKLGTGLFLRCTGYGIVESNLKTSQVTRLGVSAANQEKEFIK
jgi:hypothetical protein